MPIEVNGQPVGDITLNGNTIDEVTVNGTVVYSQETLPAAAAFQLDANTISLSNGSTVNTWQDQIGNNDATIRSGNPTYLSSGFNGKPTVDMSDTTDAFDFPEFLQSQLGATSAEVAGVILLQNDQNTEAGGFMHYSGDDINEHLTWSNGSYYSELFSSFRRQIPAPSGLTTGARFVFNVGSGSTWSTYFNNIESYEDSSGSVQFTPQGPIIGDKNTSSALSSGFGYVSEVVIYDRKLTDTERGEEYNRLENKWGPFDTL